MKMGAIQKERVEFVKGNLVSTHTHVRPARVCTHRQGETFGRLSLSLSVKRITAPCCSREEESGATGVTVRTAWIAREEETERKCGRERKKGKAAEE